MALFSVATTIRAVSNPSFLAQVVRLTVSLVHTGFLLDPNATFIANFSACEDHGFVRREILEMSELSHFSWFQSWTTSGLLSSILLKAALANFALALLRCADPLSQSDGSFLAPPSPFDPELNDVEEMKLLWQTNLRLGAFRGAILWGLCIIVMVLNLFLIDSTRDSPPNEDITNGCILISISVLVVLLAWSAHLCFLRNLDTIDKTSNHGIAVDPVVRDDE